MQWLLTSNSTGSTGKLRRGTTRTGANSCPSISRSKDPAQRPDRGGAAAKSCWRTCVVVKELDKAGPKLAESVCTGKVFPKVDIHVTAPGGGAGGITYYAYELQNVQIVSYHIGGSVEADEIPIEEFSLKFEEIKVTYNLISGKGKEKGKVEYSHKVEKG